MSSNVISRGSAEYKSSQIDKAESTLYSLWRDSLASRFSTCCSWIKKSVAPQLHAISYATLKGISGCAKCVGFCMWLSYFPNLQISFLNLTLRADPSVLHALESLEVCLKLCRTLHEFPLLQRKIETDGAFTHFLCIPFRSTLTFLHCGALLPEIITTQRFFHPLLPWSTAQRNISRHLKGRWYLSQKHFSNMMLVGRSLMRRVCHQGGNRNGFSIAGFASTERLVVHLKRMTKTNTWMKNQGLDFIFHAMGYIHSWRRSIGIRLPSMQSSWIYRMRHPVWMACEVGCEWNLPLARMMTTSPSVLLSLKSSNIQWHHHFLIFSIEIVIWGYPIFRQNRTEQGTRPSPILPTLQKMRRPDHPTTRQPVPSCELHTTLLAAGGLPCTGASTSFTCREGASKILEDRDIGLMGPRIFFRCISFFFLLLCTVYIYMYGM